MIRRILVLLAALAAGLAAAVAAAAAPASAARPHAAGLSTKPASYLGVYENETPGSYAQVTAFAKMAGRQPNVLMYYTDLSGAFPAAFAQEAWSHRTMLLVTLEPSNVSMAAIAAGRDDAFLRSYAAQVRSFGHPVLISFAPEMNGHWYSWGWTHTAPKTWIAGWRHVVTVFRRAGVTNATWLWTVNEMTSGEGPVADWWPGSSYVSWVSIDGYFYRRGDTFRSVFGPTIAAVRALSSKPVFIGETAIGQVAGQARKIPLLFAGISQYRLLGLVWFDANQSGSLFKQDWRLEGHPAAEAAFRKAVRRYLR
jgi:hypothetical protein